MGIEGMHGWRWNREWLRLHEPVGWRWFHKISIAIVLLFVLVHHLWTAPVHAQHRDLVSGEDLAPGEADLSIKYAIDGSSTIYFNRWFDVPPPQALPQKLVSTVERLGPDCQAEWGSPYSDEYSFSHFLSCDRTAFRSGLVQRSQLDLQSLLELLQDSGTTSFDISITIPDFLPFHVLPARFDPVTSIDWLRNNSSQFSASIELSGDVEMGSLLVEYGYRWQDVQRMMLPLMAISLFAPLLTAVGRRWALRRMQATDKTAGFQLQMYHSVSVLLIWGSWALAVLGMRWQSLLDLVTSAMPAWGPPVVGFIGLTTFPAAICLLCRWIVYPVTARVGRVKPALKKVVLEGAIEQGLIAEAFAVYIAIPLVTQGEIRLAILWFVMTAASAFVLKFLQTQLSGLIPQSITVGPLRDRVFELALSADVNIEQLYVLPTRKTQVANAFAVSGGVVMLTDYLLENLTKREVDAVIAHELTHFERNHHASQGALMTVAGLLIFAGTLWNPANYFGLFFVLSILGLGGAFAGQMHQSRRHEYEADWGAAKLTGDPEAMISALAAITELAEMPAMWNPLAEALGTHPSLQNRANAIANAYQIPADRVEQLLLTPDSNRETYSIPSSSDQPVYSSEAKSGNALKAVLLLSCTAVMVSVGAVLLCRVLFPSLNYVPIAVATIASFMALLWADNHTAQLGMKTLGVRLRHKFEPQGWNAGDCAGVQAGFSPSLQPQLYEGSVFWDMGLLYLSSDRLAYIGEQTQFSLPVDAVCYVGATKLRFEWFRLMLIQIQWSNSDGEIESGYLAIREGNTAIDLKQDARQWLARLQAWQQGNNSDPSLPNKLQNLPLPTIGTVTSSPVKTLQAGFKLAWFTVLPASALLSIVLGLSALNAFYVCVSACLAFWAHQLPILLFTGTESAAATPSHPPLLNDSSDATPVLAGEGDLESV